MATRNAYNMTRVDEAVTAATRRMSSTRLEQLRIPPRWSASRALEAKNAALVVCWNRERKERHHKAQAEEQKRHLAHRERIDVLRLKSETQLFENNLARLGEEHWKRAALSMFQNLRQRHLKDRCLIWYKSTPAGVQKVCSRWPERGS